jgi:hypothetical protein
MFKINVIRKLPFGLKGKFMNFIILKIMIIPSPWFQAIPYYLCMEVSNSKTYSSK